LTVDLHKHYHYLVCLKVQDGRHGTNAFLGSIGCLGHARSPLLIGFFVKVINSLQEPASINQEKLGREIPLFPHTS
jgi:hypothetical protein